MAVRLRDVKLYPSGAGLLTAIAQTMKIFWTRENKHYNKWQEKFAQHETWSDWDDVASRFYGLRLTYFESFGLVPSVNFMYARNVYVSRDLRMSKLHMLRAICIWFCPSSCYGERLLGPTHIREAIELHLEGYLQLLSQHIPYLPPHLETAISIIILRTRGIQILQNKNVLKLMEAVCIVNRSLDLAHCCNYYNDTSQTVRFSCSWNKL
jgi:hypothetical protein